MTDGILAFLLFVRDAVIGVLMAWLGVSVVENASKDSPALQPEPAAIHVVQSAEETPCPERGGGGAPSVQATGASVSRSER